MIMRYQSTFKRYQSLREQHGIECQMRQSHKLLVTKQGLVDGQQTIDVEGVCVYKGSDVSHVKDYQSVFLLFEIRLRMDASIHTQTPQQS